jgi:phosphoribosylformylglycinamidine cyclo-ligase
MARACRANGCALLGGETAEMPGFYAEGEYDLAGFIVGIVDRSKVVDGRAIGPGDAVLALPSSGLHTNGYSLARRVLLDRPGTGVDTYVELLGATLGDALLATHRSYLPIVGPLLARDLVKGLAHITGGGLTENVPRILPAGCGVDIQRRAWTIPPIFQLIERQGGIDRAEMFRAFNMGVGMVVVCAEAHADELLKTIAATGEGGAFRIGRVVAGAGVSYV